VGLGQASAAVENKTRALVPEGLTPELDIAVSLDENGHNDEIPSTLQTRDYCCTPDRSNSNGGQFW
jgi:hypothetical protein